MRTTILLVEDEEAISRPLAGALAREGFDVRVVSSGQAALDEVVVRQPDLVLLDLMLPDGDGRDVCREIRVRSDVPIIMVTARGDEIDTVLGLELGADDYVAKPFSARELIARIRAVLRRGRGTRRNVPIRIGEVLLDPAAHSVTKGDKEIDLTAKEFDLLRLLMERAGQVVSREDIMDEVWDPHWFGPTKTLDVHVSTLRKKLGDHPASPTYIRTLRGVGFRFTTSDEVPASEAAAG